jgi:hypothetical protein
MMAASAFGPHQNSSSVNSNSRRTICIRVHLRLFLAEFALSS